MQSQPMRGRASLDSFVPLRLTFCMQQEVGTFVCVCVLFFLLHLPGGRKQSVLGDEVLATIYIGRFVIFHASPGSGIFIV